MATTVKYDGTTISPAPFVSKTMEAVDYGDRWGAAQNIVLRGHITGTNGTGKLSVLTDIFAQGFKTLLVESAGDNNYYSASNCVLQSLSFDNNKFSEGSDIPVPYTVTLKSYDVPSGVIDVSSEYSYKENKNGTVSVSHTTSAKGVKTSSSDPIDNAYNFVALFTGVDPVSSFGPFLIEGATQSVLRSVNENVNRLNASYSVTEDWEYETGSSNAYTSTSSLNIEEDVSQEYINLTLNLGFKGDTVNSNFSTVRNAVRDFDVYNKLNDYGIVTGNVFINNFNVSEDEKASSIIYDVSFFSGEASQALTGLMIHNVSMVWDEIKNEKNFTINSEFKIKGPETYRAKKVSEKKDLIVRDYDSYIPYLYHAVKDSEVYNQFETLLGDGHELNPNPSNFTIKENNTKHDFSMSASFSDKDFKTKETITLPNLKTYPISIGQSNYSVTVTPENWIFQMDPAANIEGHFIVQDLQCMTRERIGVTASNEDLGKGIGEATNLSRFDSFTGVSGIMVDIINSISGLNTDNRFYLTNNNVNSGEFSTSIKKDYILKTGIVGDFGKNKFNGFLGQGYGRRVNGFKFGF